MQSLLLVAVGGALGSLVRFKLGGAILHHSAAAQFPYGTFVVNVLGCLAAGLLAGLGEHFDFLSAGARLFLFTGSWGASPPFQPSVWRPLPWSSAGSGASRRATYC